MGIITISRQIGAGETSISPALAAELGWELIDHRLLDAQVEQMGVQLPAVLHYDERAPGLLDAWTHPHQADSYYRSLATLMEGYGKQGNVVVVGRGGHLFLRDADALHLRLTADMAFRIRRVMEVRWVTEEVARDIILQSDHNRASFSRHYFKVDWSDPLQYDVVMNTGRFGTTPLTQIVLAMVRLRWGPRLDGGTHV